MNFEAAFAGVIGNEGGYSNNPDDPGGETMWGITVAVARANGYTGEMQLMPKETASAIYQRRYWVPAGCDRLPDGVDFQVFDAAVNSGVINAVKWLQQAVGSPADGVFGPNTQAAAHAIDPKTTILRFNAYRLKFYTSIQSWQSFGKGWANRIAANLLTAAK